MQHPQMPVDYLSEGRDSVFDPSEDKFVEEQIDLNKLMKAQKIWRTTFQPLRTFNLVSNFLLYGPSLDRIKGLNYEECMKLLNNKFAAKRFSMALQRLYLCSNIMDGGSKDKSIYDEDATVKTYTYAYSILLHPGRVFESANESSEECIATSTRWIKTFEKLCLEVKGLGERHGFHTIYRSQPRNFSEQLEAFRAAYKPVEELSRSMACDGVREQIFILIDIMKKAINAGDNVTHAVVGRKIKMLHADLLCIGGRIEIAKLGEAAITEIAGILCVGCGDTKGSNASLCESLLCLPSQELLVHELMLNPDLSLEDSQQPLCALIRGRDYEDQWDLVTAELDGGARSGYMEIVVRDLMSQTCEFANSQEERRLIQESINYDLMEKLVYQNGSGYVGEQNWGMWKDTMCGFWKVLCTLGTGEPVPARRDAWNLLKKELDECSLDNRSKRIVSALNFFLCFLVRLRLGRVAESIKTESKLLKTKGIPYLRAMFHARLVSGNTKVDATRKWIEGAVRHCVKEEYLTPEDILSKDIYPLVIHALAMSSLMLSLVPPQSDTIPETLRMDINRISCIYVMFQYIVTASTMLIGITAVISSADNQNITKNNIAFNKAKDYLVDSSIAPTYVDGPVELNVEAIVANILRIMQEYSTLTKEELGNLKQGLFQCAKCTYRIHSDMRNTFYVLLFTTLTGENANELTKQMIAGKDFLPLFVRTAKELVPIGRLNGLTHADMYLTMAKNVATKIRAERGKEGKPQGQQKPSDVDVENCIKQSKKVTSETMGILTRGFLNSNGPAGPAARKSTNHTSPAAGISDFKDHNTITIDDLRKEKRKVEAELQKRSAQSAADKPAAKVKASEEYTEEEFLAEIKAAEKDTGYKVADPAAVTRIALAMLKDIKVKKGPGVDTTSTKAEGAEAAPAKDTKAEGAEAAPAKDTKAEDAKAPPAAKATASAAKATAPAAKATASAAKATAPAAKATAPAAKATAPAAKATAPAAKATAPAAKATAPAGIVPHKAAAADAVVKRIYSPGVAEAAMDLLNNNEGPMLRIIAAAQPAPPPPRDARVNATTATTRNAPLQENQVYLTPVPGIPIEHGEMDSGDGEAPEGSHWGYQYISTPTPHYVKLVLVFTNNTGGSQPIDPRLPIPMPMYPVNDRRDGRGLFADLPDHMRADFEALPVDPPGQFRSPSVPDPDIEPPVPRRDFEAPPEVPPGQLRSPSVPDPDIEPPVVRRPKSLRGRSMLVCDNCDGRAKEGDKIRKCGRCGDAVYCSRICQLAHWPVHKARCVVKKVEEAGGR